jgi:putative alpha-1,2-mannosidase
MFPKMTVQRPAGNIVVIANNASATNIYVENVQLNGKNLTEPFIQWEQMKNGCTLEFWMVDAPSTWGQVFPPPNSM